MKTMIPRGPTTGDLVMMKLCLTVFRRLTALTVCAASLATAQNAPESIVLFRPQPHQTIRDGRYGAVILFQRQLAVAAETCGISIPDERSFADGTIGPATAQTISKVTACASIGPSLAVDDPARKGAISTGLWHVISPDIVVPSAQSRAHTMTFSYEATDYTDIEFNVGTRDQGILTWGPLGATAGQAFQVQAILRKIDDKSPLLIGENFGSEAESVRSLSQTRTESSATALVSSVAAVPARRAAWTQGFRSLASSKDVRDIYDAVMGDKGTSGIFEGVADFYCSYWTNGWVPTEVDYAFFFDRAVQIDVRQEKTREATAAVAAFEAKAHRFLSPAERRRIIAANFTAGNLSWVADRLARDVAYYIDSIPEPTLSNESLVSLRDTHAPALMDLKDEIHLWKVRSGKKASDFGLSDARLAPPPDMMATARSKCIAPTLVAK
ncbi:hypothetical protein [Caballeronia sordidicola]|uniref:hypothetical protein n=1 Tax=Caballeronia sordidicola TaxID=196367 RepID=UPI0004D010A3|nr:hypothetical protein [Caballeronia sordidicola]